MYIQGSSVAIQTPAPLEPDWPQRDCPAACVIAQQYSSSAYSLIELLLSQQKKKKEIQPAFKNVTISVSQTCCIFSCSTPGMSKFPEHGDAFLGAFAKLPKAAIRSVMSVRPSFRPHGTTGFPFDGHL
jgi:hypothetical protein